MKRMVSTLVVADDDLSRSGLLGILSRGRYKAIAAKECCRSIVAFEPPHARVVICILSGVIDLEAFASKVEVMAHRSRVVILADELDARLVEALIRAGAVACLSRSIPGHILLRTLDLVLDGEMIVAASAFRAALLCEEFGRQQLSPSSFAESQAKRPDRSLSSREMDILKLLGTGDSNKQISRRLEISETTVKVHVKAILRKLQISNRTQAAIWAKDNNVVGCANRSLDSTSLSTVLNEGEDLGATPNASERIKGVAVISTTDIAAPNHRRKRASNGTQEYRNGHQAALDRMAQLRAERLAREPVS